MNIIDARIQSDSYKPRTQVVDTLVIHYTALELQPSLKVLRYRDVSVHYVLAENGDIYKILEDNEVCYQAGLSMWRGKPRVNDRSIGIEIVNMDGNSNKYPEAQIKALIELCAYIKQKNPGIKDSNIVGHSDVAPKRKGDPGKLFPWKILGDNGIGLWPLNVLPQPIASAQKIQEILVKIGYPAPHAYGRKGESMTYVSDPQNPPAGVSKITKVETSDILKSFQLRYQPNKVDGVADKETMGMLIALSNLI